MAFGRKMAAIPMETFSHHVDYEYYCTLPGSIVELVIKLII
jgi:hypothetical protein